ncbi:hypothetical protein AVEN_145851-1 [Araneus ventricosus]|uniref:Uncharacterized protein n=1 Tax=Araneus ventricosus TaxID=182803 RepID=A0A4Y2ULH6_ARAVE|nr:hypothetical protein AVEN_145851-1 [Araneus ventricosus]
MNGYSRFSLVSLQPEHKCGLGNSFRKILSYRQEKNPEQGCLEYTGRRKEGYKYKINSNIWQPQPLPLGENSFSNEVQREMRLPPVLSTPNEINPFLHPKMQWDISFP